MNDFLENFLKKNLIVFCESFVHELHVKFVNARMKCKIFFIKNIFAKLFVDF